MADIIKRVILEGDSSGFEKVLDKTGQATTTLYERIKRDAESYSNNLSKQSQYIERVLSLEQRRVELQLRERRERVKAEIEENIASGKIQARYAKEIRKSPDYGSTVGFLSSKRQEIEEARLENKMAPRGEPVDAEWSEVTGAGAGATVARAGRGIARGVSSGLGIGLGLGVAGIVYELVNQAVQFQKSTLMLTSVMGNLNLATSETASGIGKSVVQMNEYTKQVVLQSAGMFGAKTGNVAIFGARFEKAFGLDEGTFANLMPAARMFAPGKNITDELYNMMKSFNQTGGISLRDRNFARLPEMMDYWNRLNMMQSQHMAYVNPTSSTALISAFNRTRVPFLSDQRMMQTMQSIQQGITQPGNDFQQAFMFQMLAPSAGNNFVNTRIMQERGIFGQGVLKNVMEGLRGRFGGGNLVEEGTDLTGLRRTTRAGDQMTLAMSSLLRIGTETAKTIVTELMSNPSKLSRFYEDLERVKSDPKARSRVESILGPIETLAEKQTATNEKLVAAFTNFMGENGTKLFKLSVDKFEAAVRLLQLGESTPSWVPEKFQGKGIFSSGRFHKLPLIPGYGIGTSATGSGGFQDFTSMISGILFVMSQYPNYQQEVQEVLGDVISPGGGSYAKEITPAKGNKIRELLKKMLQQHPSMFPAQKGFGSNSNAETVDTTGDGLKSLADSVKELNKNLSKNTEETAGNTEETRKKSTFESLKSWWEGGLVH